MYPRKEFDEREAEYSVLFRRKLEEEEAMLQHLAPSRARSLALTKLDEALFWANVSIAEAGLQQCYTAVPRNRGYDFDDALATNVDGQQVRATRAGDITLDGMKLTRDSVENHSSLKSGLDTIDHQKLLHRKKLPWGRTARPTSWPNWNCWRGLRRTGIMP